MYTPKKNVIAIVGTTGVGKSQFSIELAKAINGEIINADSMQVYKGLEIITNKHPLNERENIEHHVMDHVNWDEEYYIHRFAEEANSAIQRIHSQGKIPIIIGGTHYYLQTLLFRNKTIGEMEFNNPNITKRELSDEHFQILNGPTDIMFDKLKSADPVVAEKFHPQDRRKIRRALEIAYTTGMKPSELYQEQKLTELEDSSLKYNTLFFWVYSNPEVLKARLDRRVDNMMENGALKEIESMYNFYSTISPQPECTNGIWQVIGFKEFLPWLQSDKSNTSLFEEGKERMQIRTRQYAKYQVKWIKKLLGVELSKEARFNFKYGGKLYVLDSTDLDNWKKNVANRGTDIASQFLLGGPRSVTLPEIPQPLESSLSDVSGRSLTESNKVLGAESNWKHYECEVCRDKYGKQLVAVGERNWKLHLESRRHRRSKYLLDKAEKGKKSNLSEQSSN